MKVLWEHDKNLTIQEITNCMDGLSVASITQSIKHLINKKAVVVSEHILVSNVYARTFKTCFTQEEFLAGEFKRLQKSVFGTKKSNVIGIAAALFNNSGKGEIKAEQIDELQKIIDEKKQELK